jgi:hypothetical protein
MLIQNAQEALFQDAGARYIEDIEARKPEPVQAREIDPDDPFDGWGGFSDAELAAVKEERAGLLTVGGVTGRGSPFKAREHYPRAARALMEIHPGRYFACDQKAISGYGRDMVVLDRDALGFLDILGWSGGRVIGCNVTTIGSIQAHLRKWTTPDLAYKGQVYGFGSKRVIDLLRDFLSDGNLMYLLGSYQAQKGAAWHYKVLEVTENTLDQAVARKRGPKVRR